MSDFSEKQILLVTDKFEFNQDGLDFIKSLSGKKISIISVIGPKASGKSFLSNQLIGIFKNGFEIGSIENRTECCTKGIWIWGKPQIFNDKYILILDAQGFQSENEEQIKFNQKLFILFLYSSSKGSSSSSKYKLINISFSSIGGGKTKILILLLKYLS